MRGLPAPLIRERVEEAMASVGITQLCQSPPHKLSGGQRQRLAIAGILALRPQCIIADEATSMLDPFSRQELTQLLSQLNQDYGLTIVQVTHLLEEAVYADRVVVMEQGRITLEAAPAPFFSDLARLQSLKLVIPDPIILADRLRAAGFPIAQGAVTVDAIAKEIARDCRDYYRRPSLSRLFHGTSYKDRFARYQFNGFTGQLRCYHRFQWIW